MTKTESHGFKSANLKLIYEELRDLGVPLSASEVAHLFRFDEVQAVLEKARAHAAEIKFYELAIRHLEKRLQTLDPSSAEYAAVAAALADYRWKYRELIYQVEATEEWF